MESLIWLLITLCTFVMVDCQIYCTKTMVVSAPTPETYQKVGVKTYRTFQGYGCYRSGCIRRRYGQITATRLVTKTSLKPVTYCCDGYIQAEQPTISENITCLPVCIPACKNGVCKSPGQCECNSGYGPILGDTRNCQPLCSNIDCEHGKCTKPDHCDCNDGYTRTIDKCEPICTDPCYNATCVAPDTCECLPGYRKTENNNCEPYCSSGCENGTCVGPETCRCNAGYSMAVSHDGNETNKSCEPVCTDSCVNGVCVAPDTCSCLPGYEKSENDTCSPYCSNGCENGSCVAPDNCLCNAGWHSGITTKRCEPSCTECGNGTCVAPETCECFPGYKLNLTCIPYCDDGCTGGKCVSPNVCQCESGWEYKNGTCALKSVVEEISTMTTEVTMESETVPTSQKVTGDYFDYNDGVESGMYENVQPNSSINNQTSEPERMSWFQQHWEYIAIIIIPLIIAVILIMLLAYYWGRVCRYVKGDSYVIQGNGSEIHGASSFVDVRFSDLNGKDKTPN